MATLQKHRLKSYECHLVGLALGGGDVEVGGLQDERVLDVADEGVGEVRQPLAQVPEAKIIEFQDLLCSTFGTLARLNLHMN